MLPTFLFDRAILNEHRKVGLDGDGSSQKDLFSLLSLTGVSRGKKETVSGLVLAKPALLTLMHRPTHPLTLLSILYTVSILCFGQLSTPFLLLSVLSTCVDALAWIGSCNLERNLPP